MASRVERAMMSFYPAIKHTHIAMVLLSGGLFALRGLSLCLGMRWPHSALVRGLSYVIDTTLLTAALLLLTILPDGLFANGWLLVKLGFVVAYIMLGVLAFRAQRGLRARVLLWLCALLCYAQVYAIARSHDPHGLLLWL